MSEPPAVAGGSFPLWLGPPATAGGSDTIKTMCQLEGCDRGGRDSAAELALAGGIDVNVGRLFQPADFGVSPDPTRKLYSLRNIRQRLC